MILSIAVNVTSSSNQEILFFKLWQTGRTTLYNLIVGFQKFVRKFVALDSSPHPI